MRIEQNKRRYLIIFIIAFGTTAMYSIIGMKASFYSQMQQALKLTNLELGNIISFYGIVAMISYFIGGIISDRFSARNLVSFSLVSSGIIGIIFSTVPNYNVLIVLSILLGITSVFTFWSSSIKIISFQGNELEQGKLFGLNEGVSGISGAIVSLIGLYMFKLLDIEYGFQYLITIYSVISIVCGIMIYLLIKNENVKKNKTEFSNLNFFEVMKNKKAWCIGIVIFSTHMIFSSLTYLSPYLEDVYFMSLTYVSFFSIIRTYIIKIIICPILGIVSDRLTSHIDTIYICIVLSIISILTFLVIPKDEKMLIIAILNMLFLSTIIFGIRGIYFTIIPESNIQVKDSGSLIGFVSLIGFSPDAFLYTLVGKWIDDYGILGYRYLFFLLIATSIFGIIALIELKKLNKKDFIYIDG